eukprot:1195308-Prorocentrum_minimum.AAC.11
MAFAIYLPLACVRFTLTHSDPAAWADIEKTQGTSWFLVSDQGSTNKTFLSRSRGGVKGKRQLPSNVQSEVRGRVSVIEEASGARAFE